MEQRDPVPGLGRGLAILAHLSREGACSLERIAADLALPKSSASRLLDSLILAHCVERDPINKRFHARRMLVTVGAEGDVDVRAQLADIPVSLAAATKTTVEVFTWLDQRLVMIDRADPEDREVVVRARVGWVRPLEEIDALVQLAIAHGNLQPPAKGWRWQDGKQMSVPKETTVHLAERARVQGWACDSGANSQGVIRAAAPLLWQGRLVGMLTLACPAAQAPSPEAIAALKNAAQQCTDRSPVLGEKSL